MPTGAQGQTPLQQFIENFMQMAQFRQAEQQFGARQVLAQRDAENAEINQFAALAPFVSSPEERATLSQFFAGRNPDMADTFVALSAAIPISEQVFRSRKIAEGQGGVDAGEVAAVALTGQSRGALAVSGATAGRSKEELVAGQRIGEGQALSAGQVQQGSQFAQNLTETQRQHALDFGQRTRGLNIQEFGVEQTGVMGRLSTMFGAGFGEEMLIGEHSQEIAEIEAQLQDQSLRPEQRAGLGARRREIEASIKGLQARMAARDAATRGRAGSGGGIELSQLLTASNQAFDNVQAAKNPAEQEIAIQEFNFIRSMLPIEGQIHMAAKIGWVDQLMNVPGGVEGAPADSTTETPLLPFITQPGGAR